MTGSRQVVFAWCLFLGAYSLAHAQAAHAESRGEMLYATHCNACHTSKIYWRKQRSATNWNSLKDQVRRWQASTGLDWSEEDIRDVTDYLNAVYYGFPVVGQEGLSQEIKPIHVLRQDSN